VRLTPRGIRLLLVGPLLLGIGEVLGHGFLRGLGGVALAVVGAGVLVTAGGLGVNVVREVSPPRVTRGDAALAELVITNRGRHRIPAFVVADRVGDHRIALRVPGLGPGDRLTRTYRLPTSRRGPVGVGPLLLSRGDPLGLAVARAGTGDTRTLWVYPRLHPARVVPAGHARTFSGTSADSPRRGSVDFHSLREYVVGDEPRHLHWKSTAKTGQLMVREFVDLQQPRLVVLLDTRSEQLDPDSFEEAVEVAASLVRASTDSDRPTRLRTTAGLDVDTAAGATARDLLDRLTEVAQSDRNTTGRRPRQLVADEVGGSTVVVVSGQLAEGDRLDLAALRQRVDQVVLVELDRGHPDPGESPAPGGTAEVVAGLTGALLVRAPDAASAIGSWNAVMSR
jgi:uncharacterized protein (DUF58 family)